MTPELQVLTVSNALAYGLDANLLEALLWEESRYCHVREGKLTTSHAGALGIGQLMPGTARELGVNPEVLEQNVQGTADYLRQQWDTFGDWHLALAAYNAGPGAVATYNGVPPYEETQAYVKKVLESYARLSAEPEPNVVSEPVVRSAVVFRAKGEPSGSAVIHRRQH